MTIHQKLAAVPKGGLDITKAVDVSFAVDGTTNQEKERPKKRHSSLNPKISTTITMGDNSSTSAATSAGTSTSTAGDSTDGTSTTSGSNEKAGATVFTIPPSSATNNPLQNAAGEFLPRDTSSRTDVGGGSGKPRLQKMWTVEEEKKLVSAVETFGTTIWANIAAHIPGRSDAQCYRKWQYLSSSKAAATSSGTWTVEEEQKLASAVETFGTTG
jgi:hypothetical protein